MRESKYQDFTLIMVVIAITAYAWSFYPFLADDALISLQYSKRLIEGHGLTWTDGIPVEGYTNLSWVLLAACLGWLGVDLVWAVRLLGVVFTIACAASFFYFQTILGHRVAKRTQILAVLLYGLCGTTAVWSLGGLEQPLVAASLAWATIGVLRIVNSPQPDPAMAWMPGWAYAVMCLTRPDSPLFVVSSCLALLLIWKISNQQIVWRILMVLAGVPLLAYVFQTGFRFVYYDAWVTNTALVKMNPSWQYALRGGKYMVMGLISMLPMVLFSVFAWHRMSKIGLAKLLPVLIIPLMVWGFYVSIIGGDIFPAFRHCTPVVVLMCLSVSLCLPSFLQHLGQAANTLILGVTGVLLLACQNLMPHIRIAYEERWEWTCKDIALTLREGFSPVKPLTAVTAAGCWPYWSDFPAIDMLGLNDHYLPRHPPKSIHHDLIGHQLGDGAYILSRKPDLIIYDVGSKNDAFLTGKQLIHMPDFISSYMPVTFVIQTNEGEIKPTVWLRWRSGVLGLQRSAEHLMIPGYLLQAGGASPARISTDRQYFLTTIPAHKSATFVLPSELSGIRPDAFSLLNASGPWHVKTWRTPSGNLALEVVAGARDVSFRSVRILLEKRS